MLRALWAAASGDTTVARGWLRRVRESARVDPVVGHAPTLVEGWIAARAGRWNVVIDTLRGVARRGELDPTMLDRPASFHSRCLIATAFERTGQLDSAVAYLELALRPAMLPPTHYSLRGIPFGFAHLKAARLYARQADTTAAARHFDTFLASFDRADDSVQGLVVGARQERQRLTGVIGTEGSAARSTAGTPPR